MPLPSKSLTAGQDYPESWSQFCSWFHDEISCVDYLLKMRWPEGFACPRCGAKGSPYQLSRKRMMCRSCRYQCTVTAGTIFEKTRIPLRDWFAAVWYITNQKNGVSALGLKSALGLGSYQTAWSMLHKLRRAMVNPHRDKLRGVVEVDETFLGGPEVGKRSSIQYLAKKVTVIIAVEMLAPKGFGRVRLRRISSASKENTLPFIQEEIETGATIQTDGSPIYNAVQDLGYIRDKIVHLGAKDPAHVTMPGVHRVASLLKRWLLGTFQGSVKSEHLDYYLDEFSFRFNRRTSKSRGLLFYRLLEQSVITDPITYQGIKNSKHNI
jgi:transposase-like protein